MVEMVQVFYTLKRRGDRYEMLYLYEHRKDESQFSILYPQALNLAVHISSPRYTRLVTISGEINPWIEYLMSRGFQAHESLHCKKQFSHIKINISKQSV